MDDLPTLLPMWHSVTLRSALGTPQYGNDAAIFPDHTGAGVDISFKRGFRECVELKSPSVRSSFAAKSCALPFLPPNKVKSLHDPCLQNLRNQRKKQTDFCTKLGLLLAHFNRKTSFYDSVLAADSSVSSLDNIEECEQLSIPQKVVELAEAMPEHCPAPPANWRYTNGCLATLPYTEGEYSNLLFYPTGPKMNKLRLTPIKETSSKHKSIMACEEQQRTMKLSGGTIYQTEAAEVQGTRLCCVRQEKKYHFVNLDVLDENEDLSFESFSLECEISSIAMSPFEVGKHAIITKDGFLLIQDANTKTTFWQLEEPLQHDANVSDMWWGCSFGRSSPSLLCMDRTNLLLYDLRRKKKSIRIFSTLNPFLLKDEQLMVFKPWPGNSYQYMMVSDHHLIIWDERYPEQPVLVMNHMMEGFPIYCSVAPYDNSSSEYVVLLGSQEEQEIASFVIQSSKSVVQPFSLGPPLHLSGISDCVQSVRLQGHAVDDRITKRLSVPLIGVCAIPHTRKIGFTALQLSSVGDMFYQCFQACDKNKLEKTWKVSPGCVLPPPGKIFPELNGWMDLALVKEKSPRGAWNNVDKSHFLSCVLVQKDRSSRCSLCKHKKLLEGEKEVDREICPSCGLQSDTSQQLMDAMEHGRIIVQPSSENNSFPALNLVDLSKSSGPLSKKLLEVWEDVNCMPSQVTQNEENFIQSLISTSETTHKNHKKRRSSGASIEHIICSVDPANVMSDSDRDSRTPSIDGLLVQRTANVDEEDVIAPSQVIQPLVGETLRTPKNAKKPKLYSSSGF